MKKTIITFTMLTIIGFNSIARDGGLEPSAQKEIVFIAGFDQGSNTYYSNARLHFSQSKYVLVENVYTLSEILTWLRLHYDKRMHSNIHVVSHSNPWYGLSMKTTPDGERITEATLERSLTYNLITPLAGNVLDQDTKLIFHSCGLGQNKALLVLLKRTITKTASVRLYASDLFNVFGGKYSGHYLAKTYYGYYPTAYSPGPWQLAKEFEATYPTVNADWEQVLKTRTEQLPGDMYTYKFNIPIEWEFEFEDETDLPEFTSKDDVIDWIKAIDDLKNEVSKFNIPIEKFRWLFKTLGNTLIIKGKTTVLCVLQPVMHPQNTKKHASADIETEHYVKI